MNIIGIHDGHNASVALIRDGKIVYALQEERVSRVKNKQGFPKGALETLLEEGAAVRPPRDMHFVRSVL